MTVRGAPTVEHAHAVHWYERDDVLLDRLVEHFAPTLRGGANALVIASAAHRTLLRTGLADIGVDAALLDERLTLLDAEECLNRFVVDGQLDTDAFETSIAGPVRAAVAGGQRLSAYGEMVAVLWQAGDVTGALELERLWNALQRDVPFTLLCGYPSELFIDPHSATAFAEMGALHSQVVGGAPMPADAEASRRFPYGAHGPRLARRFVAETLTTWNLRDLIDRCVLVTSELATNAVRHGGSDFTVSLGRDASGVTVTVGDAGRGIPRARGTDALNPGGRGLHLVDWSADRWGHRELDDGKLVWAHVAADADESRVG